MTSDFRKIKIKEIMEKENLPIVKRTDPMAKVMPFPGDKSHAWVVRKEGSKKVEGVVTEHDILSVISPEESSYLLGFPDMRSLCSNCPVGDIMTEDFIKTKPAETVDDALNKIVTHRVSVLPVLDEEGVLVGEINQSHITGEVSKILSRDTE